MSDKSESPVMRKDHYYHFRATDKRGNLLPKGGATVCYMPSKDGIGGYLGYALCLPEDHFCKATGRHFSRQMAGLKVSSHFIKAPLTIEDGHRYAKKFVSNVVKTTIEAKREIISKFIDDVYDNMEHRENVLSSLVKFNKSSVSSKKMRIAV
jgi:hypothetical protein